MLRSLALACALVLAVTACGDEDGVSTTTTNGAAPTTVTTTPGTTGVETTVAPATEAPPGTTTTTAGPAVIELSYEGGEVRGVERRVTVDTGADVRIEFTADVADRVHLHGYDLFADVAPGMPAVIEFVADIPGIFEVELEDGHTLLFELEVS